MSKARLPFTLANRLCGLHLLFSVAGLLIFFAFVVLLCDPSLRFEIIAASLLVPLVVFVIGGGLIRKSMGWISQVESQLVGFQRDGWRVEDLKSIPVTKPFASGWNHLLGKVQQQEVWNGVERRLSETSNAQHLKRWEAIFQQLADGVVLCDEHGTIVESNCAFANMVAAMDSQQLVGKSLIDAVRPIVKDTDSIQSLANMLDGPAHQVSEVHLRDRVEEGVWRISMRRTNLECLGQGATVWTFRDITQSRLAEHAREQFVATATHELRTPLANIRAYAETLSTATDIQVEQQLDFFNIINNEATRLSRFVDELLNVSQMEAGAITVQKHEIYLDRLLVELVDQQRPLATEKRQTLDLLIPPKVPRVKGDKDKLAGAISNLIGNAIKYTPDAGSIKVRVEYDPSQIYIHVEDNGFGISKEDLAKLGSKFYRSGDERVQNVSGNGLGLAFAQEVARLHSGRLNVRSEINVGSCFTIEIPLT
jgi:signal transduction histidine kinase